jgi:cytochrome P450
MKKLREEIDRVLGSRETINQQDLTELQYTNCVIKETLRLWPVAAAINRISPSNCEIDSLIIPDKSWIQVVVFFCWILLKLK